METPEAPAAFYIYDVAAEKEAETQEIVLIEKPDILNKPSLHDIIFNPTFSNEFLNEYQQRFGRTEQEQNYYLTSRQGYYRDSTGALTSTTEDSERRKFAEYMTKRLVEYHADNIMKTEPSMRKIYEIKQAVSNVNVKVGPQVRFKLNYSYSGNYAKAVCENPVANALVNVQMDATKYLPTSPQEVSVGLERPLGRSIFAESYYATYGKSLTGVVRKNFSSSFSTNLTGKTILSDAVSAPSPKEDLFLLGAQYQF
jgi:hypothetical protein